MSTQSGARNYVIRIVRDPGEIDSAAWDALVQAQASATPFLRHAYLLALHASISAVEDTGWSPHFMLIEDDGTLVAAAPLYVKFHSYGEYVFDWAWARAYEQHGQRYYPKLLDAVPFTPVPGARLLARDDAARDTLLAAIRQLALQAKLSSAHLLFVDDNDRHAAQRAGWLVRSAVQFHWTQREGPPYADFAEFLASMQRDKRKKIQQERRKVADAGVTFEAREGAAITRSDWDFFYRCYELTYHAHRSTPYLTRDFFARMANTMASNWLMFIASREGEPIASSLICIDRERGAAYGRYWGATQFVPCLHFSACYYEPLAWCIAHRFARFEGGAQGEHKMARGLLPVRTWSAHWLAHPGFAEAVGDYLGQEGAHIDAYIDELNEHPPFK